MSRIARPRVGELIARGTPRGEGAAKVVFQAGEGVPSAVLDYVRAYLAQPLWSVLHRYGSTEPPRPAFLDELQTRGYVLGSFRFSIFLVAAKRPPLRRLHVIPQSAGVLQARWAGVPHDGPDVCVSWHAPCLRADSRLLLNLLASPAYIAEERGVWPQANSGLVEMLEARGFDKQTLRLSVRHSAPEPSVDV